MIIKSNTVGHSLPDPRKGLNMQGGINMNRNTLGGIADPVNDSDAANKNYVETYVNGKHKLFSVGLPVSGWSESAPYTQTVAVADILETDRPHWGVVYSDNAETALSEKEAFAMVDDLDTADGSVTFTCFEDKPEVDLTIQLEVNR